MKQPMKILKQKQTGDMLIEALISVVLMAIVGLGITFALSKVAVNLKDTKEHIITINDLRNILLSTPRSVLCPETGQFGDGTILVENCNDKLVITVSDDNGSNIILDEENTAPLTLKMGDYSVGG